ncbi:hypothetical protein ACFX2J_045371 [Malus domestica]
MGVELLIAVMLDDLKWENETPQKLPLDGLLFLCISMFTAIDCPQMPQKQLPLLIDCARVFSFTRMLIASSKLKAVCTTRLNLLDGGSLFISFMVLRNKRISEN